VTIFVVCWTKSPDINISSCIRFDPNYKKQFDMQEMSSFTEMLGQHSIKAIEHQRWSYGCAYRG